MKKSVYKSFLLLSSIISSSAYSASFSDYANYDVGENKEIYVLDSGSYAMMGAIDLSSSYSSLVNFGGYLGTLGDFSDPDYGLCFGGAGTMIGAGTPVFTGYGDYSMNPASFPVIPSNRIAFVNYIAPPFTPTNFKIHDLHILLDADTSAAKGFFIENGKEVELDGASLEYRGVSEAMYMEDNSTLTMNNAAKIVYNNLLGESYGIYASPNSKVNILGNDALVLVKNNTVGVGLESGSELINNGTIVSEHGTTVKAKTARVEINGMLLSYDTDKVLDSEDSRVINNGSIILETDNGGTGLYAKNNIETKNYGVIQASDKAVTIISGSNQYSGHFLNAGIITAGNSSREAIEFDNSDNVLELQNGSNIVGKVDGKLGENILVTSGNVQFQEINNFSKLVSSGNSTINGIVNLNPTTSSDVYYTSSFTGAKSIATDLASDTSIGDLTVNGIINIGVDYDGINGETDKTGKIIASSVTLNGGKIVLRNAGNTTRNLMSESGLFSSGNGQIRIKNIIMSNKLQAVNPGFAFEVSTDLLENSEWKRETVSRIENGVTVLDELYTKMTPNPNPNPQPNPTPFAKVNPVPRNRVDLDNVNRLDWASERFLNMESRDMAVGERRQSIEYLGLKSDFNAENSYNYDYDVDTNGIMGTTLHKHTEKLFSGFTLGYSNNDVTYSNNDSEKIDSFNINVFGRYVAENFDIDAHLEYGFNEHELEADWLGAGKKESLYDSHVLKGGMTVGYNQEIGKGIKVRPNIGVDYVYVKEGRIKTQDLADIESTNGEGFTGKVGVDIGNTAEKLIWNAGVAYKQNFTDTFHEDREMINDYKMEKLDYEKGTVAANVDVDYKIAKL